MRVVVALLLLLLCGVCCAAAGTECATLVPGLLVEGSTDASCLYRIAFDDSVALDRLWTVTLDTAESDKAKLQAVVLDDSFVAFHTVSADTPGHDTLCRRVEDGALERLFWLQVVGAPHIAFNVSVNTLPRTRLSLGVGHSVVVGPLPTFLYALLDNVQSQELPLSVEVQSDDSIAAPYDLQLSWNGCPDITLRDAQHQVLTFTTVGRMLILPSQLWDGHPEVLYVGLRPNPSISAVPLRAANNSFGALKNVTVTFSYGASFTASGFAIVHWAVALAFVLVSLCVAFVISFLFCRVGLKKVRGGHTTASIEPLHNVTRKDKEASWTRGRAKAILWMVVVGGVFYLLPSLQTSSAEATSMLTTGNRDVCFFNDLCMFPLQTTGPYAVTWWAANNILSNAAYVIVGILTFSWIMWCKRHWRGQKTVLRVLSLPDDYTLLYCLSVAIIYEGLMSATYHVCPNRLIFTVDTAFMFVGAIVMSLEVYRKWFRVLPHPFLPFALLSSLLIFNYFGTLLDLYEKDTGGHADPWQVVLWALCFSLAWNVTVVLIAVRHRFRMKVWALALCTGIICLLGCVPLTSIWTDLMDRATMLLGVAVGTALLNVFAFVLGTLHHVDWPTRITRLVILACLLGTALPAMYFFNASPSNKALRAWHSRELSEPCFFYDDHDVWHFLSALALGLTLFLLMHCGESRDRDIMSQNLDHLDLSDKADAVHEKTPLLETTKK